ncbi:GDSL-type esterase/lipase family protein [Roseomonas sp. CCTCC AB2023176]|uniref:GDSL-type esterase/lipase family protein n=1 Tax=Roseomonas sp. CCTCC AB2023176 TaxID=3342640 RepID=UPI0035DB7914
MTGIVVPRRAAGALLVAAAALPRVAAAQPQGSAAEAWATSWAASVQGPYPVGNPSAQPDQGVIFPSREAGARDQSFRMIVRPTVWGRQARLRFSNAFGARPLTLDGVFVGLQLGGATVLTGTNQPVRFGGAPTTTIAPGSDAWSDPVALPFATDPWRGAARGRKLAVSFHVAGESGPMTWHAKALQTSYATAPGAGAKGAEEGEAAFPQPTASWFFLDAVDMMMPGGTPVVVCFGDSITDGTASTMNGDDRWPDVFQRRLHAAIPNRAAVVNAGIGGNQVAGPAEYGPERPFPGGPAAVQRLERDVIRLSGVSHFIWLEGINDFSRNGNASIDTVTGGVRRGVAMLRERVPGIRIIGATVITALGSTSPAHGFPEQDEKRRALNDFIRSGVFDAVVDFDAVIRDPATGGMRAEFVPESTTGGPGDKLHPNRAGYVAMANAIDPAAILPALARR